MPDLPSGTVTFLFTDIEGSTALWEQDRTAMANAVERHLALLRQAVETHGGVLFKVVGDAVQAAFPTASQAVATALTAQRALLAEDWGAFGPLRVRMALHAGAAEPDERGDYVAPALNRLDSAPVGRPWRPGAPLPCGPAARPECAPRGLLSARSGRAPPPRPARAGAGLPTRAPRPARRLPAAQVAGRPPEQPAPPAHPVPWSRAGGG